MIIHATSYLPYEYLQASLDQSRRVSIASVQTKYYRSYSYTVLLQ